MAQPNKQPPVEFRGMTGNDTFSIHTPQGSKWAKVGQSVGGYLISGYDTKTQNLQITQSGRHYTIPMGGSIITEYKPPSATIERPYTVDTTEMIPLERPIAKDAVVGAGATSNWEQEFVNSQHYKFKPEEVDKIIENSKKSSYMTEEQKKKLTQGEYFDTADTLKELGSKTFEDGVAEMIGGFTMGSVGTVLQAVVNGNISLYNEDDVKFLKDVVADSNFKKLYVASMKTQMLDGKITKSKAQQNLNNLNEIEAAFDMMPNGLSTADMNTSLSLITERAQLTREKAGKDPNLVAPLEARIKAINEELTKIGENAVQEQTTSEIPVQPEARVGEEVVEGKPQPEPEVVTEEGQVAKEEIATKQSETESKIKRKDLFDGVGTFSRQLGGSDVDAVPVSHSENNGIEFVQYANPNTGSIDVVVTGTSENDYVGFYRIYENGKPTNKWSSKFENQSRNKENFKTMISGVQSMLPSDHEYTEKTSISTDGLRVWNQQLGRGYELQFDEKGMAVCKGSGQQYILEKNQVRKG